MTNKIKKWKELSRETVFEKYGRKIDKVIFQMPDGSKSDFYLRKEGRAVCALALTKDKKVILAKQFRPGPAEIVLDLPGGAREKKETFEQAMARELLEETGYVGKIKFVVESLDAAYSSGTKNCFVATDCEKIAEPRNTSLEICEVVLVSLEEFREILRSGKMSDVASGYLALDYLGLL